MVIYNVFGKGDLAKFFVFFKEYSNTQNAKSKVYWIIKIVFSAEMQAMFDLLFKKNLSIVAKTRLKVSVTSNTIRFNITYKLNWTL